MNRTIKIYVGLLILFLGLIAFIELTKERPINWKPTYNERHKIPFGTYIFHEELENVFSDKEFTDVRKTPYEFFDEYYNWEEDEYTTTGNFIHVAQYSEMDDISAQELLDFVSYGNTVLMSSNYFPNRLKDSLGFNTTNEYDLKGNSYFTLTNPRFKTDSITIDRGINNFHFSKLDKDLTTVLGHQTFDSIAFPNFIKVKHYDGQFLLHLQPIAFTNYSLLKKNNKKYTEAVLGYLPEDNIYYNSLNKANTNVSGSKLRFILSQDALRYAWYLGLISLLLFLIFNAKRRQRIVKEIKPHENTTVAFTKTIGNLYYETKDHNNLVEKKITYFLEYLRRVYFLDTQVLDERFTKLLIQKSGKDKEQIQQLVKSIVHLKAKPQCTEADLIHLNKQIEDFYTA
ncbi:hypothetical protein FHS04_000020 [Mesoflavibacter sabulilitoris]|uniref:DUF4350 domain-containing protein n=1 Tax=Mesoflavibacter zeaxanthinifaciens subsp. sabulilitoris TaxID=1520893 RepID=A0A2T1NKS4_9FLAO|nr:DUF4350 domain-containing protein [Mesoflavibacter zeaxanthinifaciens]MBB3122532.1 hypothetical protein [Mesoflavibacter zeaxanthinifaciens subsp. sabulilitoris]PSG93508.1 hypothetical protein C7H61_03065 [Mesoflavibacter zeaxanthinifaciens subsp. sabulilitoris]